MNAKKIESWVNRGLALEATEEIDKALTSFEEALKVDPKNPDVLTRKGNVLRTTEKLQEAVECYNKAIAIKDDFIYYTYMPDLTLKRILENRPDNRMAFEYLMAYYLLSGQLNDFVRELPHLKFLGYEKIPRHFEEAILLYIGLRGEITKALPEGFGISNRTIQRFQHYQQIYSSSKDKKMAAIHELKKYYGSTYWFYAMYLKPRESQNG